MYSMYILDGCDPPVLPSLQQKYPVSFCFYQKLYKSVVKVEL